jgi:hypothetical protein
VVRDARNVPFSRLPSPQGPPTPYNALEWKATGINLVYMAVETVVYLALALLIDVARSHPRILLFFQRDPKVTDKPAPEDADVAAERARVAAEMGRIAAAGPHDSPAVDGPVIVLDSLRKVRVAGEAGGGGSCCAK